MIQMMYNSNVIYSSGVNAQPRRHDTSEKVFMYHQPIYILLMDNIDFDCESNDHIDLKKDTPDQDAARIRVLTILSLRPRTS